MSAYLNLISLFLGLLAWIMPVISIVGRKNLTRKVRLLFLIVSFSACAFSLVFQLAEINHRVDSADWSALMDTTPTLVIVSAVLVIITMILNLFALGMDPEN